MKETTRPNDKRAQLAIIMIWIVLGVQVLNSISDFLEVLLLKAIQNGTYYSPESLEINDQRQSILGFLMLGLTIASAITYLNWFRRAYYNLGLRGAKLSYNDSEIVPAFLIPFVSLYKPYKIMQDMYYEATQLLRASIPDFEGDKAKQMVSYWWAFWIISNMGSNIVARVRLQAETNETLLLSDYASLCIVAFSVPAAILAVRVISDYRGMELVMEYNQALQLDAEALTEPAPDLSKAFDGDDSQQPNAK